MILARVIGSVVATTAVDGMTGVPLRWVQPELAGGQSAGAAMVACDATRQAAEGELVWLVDGREAGLPLPVEFVPADVTIVGIVDAVSGAGGRSGQ